MMNAMHAPKLNQVTITDALFGSYTKLVADAIIPYQWEILNDRVDGAEKSYCIENFRIAAGEKTGVHRGPVFGDTDAYKWLEAVGNCIENGSGTRFIGIADGLIELIGRAQQSDGYLNTYYTIGHPAERWQNLCEGHELYAAGHLFEAAVAYYSGTGKDALLRIATRFADLICNEFGPEEGKRKGYPGHQEIELALVKLYRTTGEKRYLDLARFFIDERGKRPNYFLEERRLRNDAWLFPEFAAYDEKYAQTHMRPADQRIAEGHAVRAMYMMSAMADLARECGDEKLKSACVALWESVTKRRMYITGGIGSSGLLERFTTDYDLPNDRNYCETCASIGLMMFSERMTALTHDASYYDIVERALCNNVLAGIAITGDSYFYVNPLEVWPENCLPGTSLSHVKPVRQKWFDVACCPTNLARTLASLGRYIYAEDDRSVYIHQFISSKLETKIQGADVHVDLQSDAMTSGCVRITVSSSLPRSFMLRVRIPSYAEAPTFTQGDRTITPAMENGYAVLAVSRCEEQTFTLHFTARAAFVSANTQVRADAGRIALAKGPFVYCLEQVDNFDNLAAVRVDPNAEIRECAPVPGMPGNLPVLTYAGKRITQSVAEDGALYGHTAFSLADVTLTAVPYCLWCNRTPGEMLIWQSAIL